MDEETRTEHPEQHVVVVSDPRLLEIVEALTNLNDGWKAKLQKGTLKLQHAVQIGRTLDGERQLRYMEYVEETPVPDKYSGKVMHAFALGMPEWSVNVVLRIYGLTDKIRAVLVAYNDLMDEFEERFQRFEYDFLDGNLPREDNELERVLNEFESGFQSLYHQATAAKRERFNKTYGDSSFSTKESGTGRSGGGGGVPFPVLIGLNEEAPYEEIRRQGKRMLKKLHPDQGGSAYLFDMVKKAFDAYTQRENKPPDDIQ